MAQLARYFQKDQVLVDQTPLSVADTGGQQIGRAISGLGASLDRIAQRDEAFWVQKTLSEMDAQSDREWDAQVEGLGDSAEGFERGYMGSIDTIYNNARGQAPSRRAARQLELGILRQRNARESRARGFEIEQKFLSRQRTILTEADNLAQLAYRDPGVEPYSPHGTLIPPATDAEARGIDLTGHFTAETPDPRTGRYEVEGWFSRFYSPRDFADGTNTQDKTGGVMVSREVVAKLDWVTEQFGMGKLQINSGYRSPASNTRRADTGPNGPHTKGSAIDIQVSDLSQSERNRLYSLLRAQGFNAFGFGNGALHAEIREGEGNGRGGDFEWTYGNASKYQLVPVMQGDTRVDGTGWRSVNQYPYLALAQLTNRAETGRHNLVEGSASIATDTNGSRSYGIFGINSQGTMQSFVAANPDLGLTASPGTPEFDAQWAAAVRRNPGRMVERQLRWHESSVVQPAQRSLVTSGLGRLSNDPRAVAFVADMVVQYGPGGVEKHLAAAAGARTVEQFIGAASQSMRDNLDGDFRTYLSQNPENRAGLIARIDRRGRDSLSLAGGNGQPITGNVPMWNGPVPQISDVPGYADRLARVEAMIDTMGGTPEQRAAVRERMMNQITRGWLSSLAQQNPSAAMAALHSGQYDDALTIGDEAALTSGAESGWRAYEQEIRTAHRELLQGLQTETRAMVADEAAALAATGQGLGLLTPRHEAMMSDGDRETLELARFQHDIGRRISSARADELDGILEGLEPQGEGFATEQKMYDYAAELVQQRRERQQNDPAGYVVQSDERARDMWTSAMQSGDPRQIQSAIRALRQIQEDQGVPADRIRSVTASSMAHNEALLKDAENADVAFSNYLEMRELYGPEFGAVLREMEASGGPQGWAAVHELTEAGNAVLAKSLARVAHAGEFDEGTAIGLRMARQGSTDVARTIFDGQVKRNEISGIEPTGRSEDTDETRDQIVGRVLGDALSTSPTLVQAVREAAISHYTNSSSVGAPLDGARLEESVRAVMGGILEHNGDGGTGRFIPPIPGMTQSQWDRAIRSLRDADVSGAFVGYSEVPAPVTAEMVRDELQFVSSGNGTYFLRYPGAGLARNEQGLPYELDMNVLLPTMAERAQRTPPSRIEQPHGLPPVGDVGPDGLPSVDRQVDDVAAARADGVLTVEEQEELRLRYGPMWAYRNGERVVPTQ